MGRLSSAVGGWAAPGQAAPQPLAVLRPVLAELSPARHELPATAAERAGSETEVRDEPEVGEGSAA